MKALWLMVVVLVAAACGAGPSLSELLPIEVRTGVDLGLGPTDRLVPGFGAAVWTGRADGSVVTVELSQIVNDEQGRTTTIVIDLDGPAVSDARTVETGDARSETIRFTDGVLDLQETDPAGVVAGVLESHVTITFWADLRPEMTVETEPGKPFTLAPGAVARVGAGFVQLVGVEDSRCNKGDASTTVVCVWEGRAAAELTTLSNGEPPRSVRLEGLVTPDGPVYGDHPTVEVGSGQELILIDVSGHSAVLVWRPTE